MSKQEDLLQIKLTKLVYQQLPIGQFAEISVFFLILGIFWQETEKTLLLGWFASCMALWGARFSIAKYYNRHSKESHLTSKCWVFLLFVSALFAGLSLAPIGSFFLPETSSTKQTFVIFILLGAITAGNLFYSPIKLLYPFYLIPLYAPHIVWLFIHGSIYYAIGIMAIIYMIMMLFLSNYMNKLISESLKLQFENDALVEDLSYTNNSLQKSEETFRNALEHAPIGMGIVSLDGKWQKVNRVLCDILGYSKTEIENCSFQETTYPDDIDKSFDGSQQLLKGEINFFQIEKRYVHKNGQAIWTLLNMSLVGDEENKPIYFIAQIQDISQRKKNENIMAELNARTNSMLNELREHESEVAAISKMNDSLQTCHELNEAYTIINITAEKLFTRLNGGVVYFDAPHQVMTLTNQWGKNRILKEKFNKNDCFGLIKGSNYVIQEPGKESVCQHFEAPLQGGYMCIPLIVENKIIGLLNLNANSGETISQHDQNLAINFSDVFKLSLANIELRETLRDQAIRDPLTGLFNRRYLNEMLRSEIMRYERNKQAFCVAMIDLDHFKSFNDTSGHDAGDEVLKYVGKLLKEKCRGSDVACRFGGEEFIVVLIDTRLEQALCKMRIIREATKEKQLKYQGNLLPTITLSIGIAEIPHHALTMDGILRAADEALYIAKNSGRDRVVIV